MSTDLTGAHACPGCSQCLTTDEYCRFCEERLNLRKENELLKAELAKRPVDNPEMDATEYAHPAWWRAYDQTWTQACRLVNEILDGGPVDGVCTEPWQALRLRLADFRTRALFGDQCYQDQCENAYIEASTGKRLREELAQAKNDAQLLEACNHSMAASTSALWKILAPEYEGDLKIHDMARRTREQLALAQTHLYNLREAARAVCERWDSITWKDGQHTGVLIHQLRIAMETPEKS